jgi:hypothetical protein
MFYIYIGEVVFLDVSLNTRYFDGFFYGLLQLLLGWTASFQIFFNSSFSYHSTIEHYVICNTEGVVK